MTTEPVKTKCYKEGRYNSLKSGFRVRPAIQIVDIVMFDRCAIGKDLLAVHAKSLMVQTSVFGFQG